MGKNQIPSFQLDHRYLFIHKEGLADSAFGMDNTPELIDKGFGIYSSHRVKSKIGPLKSQFFRIGFCRKGSLQVECGLETFTHEKDTIHFNFPGQLFSMKNVSEDMFSYYILFTADFMEEILPALALQAQYPFLEFAGTPFFKLSPNESAQMEELFFKIDGEIKNNQPDKGRAIKHYLMLILIIAKRSYLRQALGADDSHAKASFLVVRYKKMVGQHFIKIRNVSDYAAKLGLTAKRLGKIVKDETGRTPSSFIDEMLMMEVKALLRHSELTISEIAYQLDFSDPSHLTTFFKNRQGIGPLKYRTEAA